MKPWYLSRTAWLNIISFALAALSLPEVAGLIPSSALPAILAISAIGNLYLKYEPKPTL
jgi:hypothetical protein